MKWRCFVFLFLIVALGLKAQYYFPPKIGSSWDTASAGQLGWCTIEKDTLVKYLEAKNTKSFIVLHKGKIVLEEYFAGFHRDTSWYWASAGKSLIAVLTGIAQEQGLLSIQDKSSDYLGTGWTIASQAKEDLITIEHQLTMTTGLDYRVPNVNCLLDTCLDYKTDAGNEWYYYNAPYRLLQDVIENASGKNINQYTQQQIKNSIGMKGFWFNHIYFSPARSMARFGLLNLNEGIWNGDTIVKDQFYFNAMRQPSQSLNPAYGYLWWLNGQSQFKLPSTDSLFFGTLVPNAPIDMYMAAGANDQRIYVVPSLDLVVVRQGDAAYSTALAISPFDNELWELLSAFVCTPVSMLESELNEPSVYPNPSNAHVNIDGLTPHSLIAIYDMQGHEIRRFRVEGESVKLFNLSSGVYAVKVISKSGKQTYSSIVLISE